ncbi:MAG TPA: PDZ domain-containing protein [Gemmatales bacterium]|nr:PDZ domain-containing protein [Gemmatales bacterium]
MNARPWLVAVAVLVTACLLIAQDPATQPPKQQQEIVNLEKQIAEMQKKLSEMKAASTTNGEKQSTALSLPEEWTKQFKWRSIGPANMSGRITAISVYETDPATYWVASASGGLIKTENYGNTFVHQFDKESTVSIGDVCVAPSNKEIVWVGTGEANPRNSVSYGDGAYKSIDGGKTWKNMGLRETYQIGKVIVHPKNPDIVYVGALGRCYGPNPERGVYKTIDGGTTWARVFYLDDKTGVIDMQMDPSNPETLIVAMWERKRDEFDSILGGTIPEGYDGYDPIMKWGTSAGLYKTTDGFKTTTKLTKGLPTNPIGRVGIDYYRKDPKVIFAIIDCQKIGMGKPPAEGVGNGDFGAFGQAGEGGVRLVAVREERAAAKAGLLAEDIITEVDGKKVTEFEDINNIVLDKKPGDKLKIKYKRGTEIKDVEVTLLERQGARPPGGGTSPGEGRPANPPVSGENLGLLGIHVKAAENAIIVTAVSQPITNQAQFLQVNDVILEIDNKNITNIAEATKQLQGKKAGDRVTLVYKRNNETRKLEVTLREASSSTQPASYHGLLGQNAEGDDLGAKITEVAKDSPAEKAGLKVGDLITALDGKDLIGYQAMVIRLRDKKVGDKIKLKYKRGSETKEVEVTLVARPANASAMSTGAGGGSAGLEGSGFAGGPGGPTRSRPYSAYYAGQRENIQDRQGEGGHEFGGIYKSTDGGESWTRINSLNPRPMYFSLIRVDPTDSNKLYVGGISMHWSQDGGKTFRSNLGRDVHADHHAIWIDSRDGRHGMVGCDGGLYVTYDNFKNVDHLNTMALGQFYHVATDTQVPYYVYGGLQDNGSWGGPSSVVRQGGSTNEDWMNINGGDGFVCRVDQDDPNWVYAESQNGAMIRRNIRTGERGFARPRTQNGINSNTFRFNWNTPFLLSSKNQKVFYCMGQYVFRSINRGDDLKIISPELTRSKRGSGSALTESPRNGDILWAGTDDGYVWVTKDGGKEWTNVTKNIGLRGDRWVSTIEASRFVDGRAYVCFDAHRSNDDKPYVYVTEDYGATWKPITANLPGFGSTRCLREDVLNQDLLYCGTEFAVFASIDRGLSWTKINNNLPTVAIHEVAVHPTAGEIVVATHGRSLWAVEVGALRQMKPATVKAEAYLYQPHTVIRYRSEPSRGGTTRRYTGENVPFGANIYFNLNKTAEKVSLKIVDAKGDTINEMLRVPTTTGLHKMNWTLTRSMSLPFGNLFEGTGGGGRRGQGGGGTAATTSGTGGAATTTGGLTSTTGGAATKEGQAAGSTTTGAGAAGQAGAGTGTGGGRRAQGGGAGRGGQAAGGGAANTQAQGTPGGAGGVGGGPGGRGFGGAVVPPGIYGVILTVDGKEYKQTIQVVGDPNVPEAFRLSEEEEEAWEVDQKTYRRKFQKD